MLRLVMIERKSNARSKEMGWHKTGNLTVPHSFHLVFSIIKRQAFKVLLGVSGGKLKSVFWSIILHLLLWSVWIQCGHVPVLPFEDDVPGPRLSRLAALQGGVLTGLAGLRRITTGLFECNHTLQLLCPRCLGCCSSLVLANLLSVPEMVRPGAQFISGTATIISLKSTLPMDLYTIVFDLEGIHF